MNSNPFPLSKILRVFCNDLSKRKEDGERQRERGNVN
jgi:hypothetical protein